jgi:predicted permease
MTRQSPPVLARFLLRLWPLGERRSEIEADLFELFATRCERRGVRYATWRYYGDVLSLWRHRGRTRSAESHAGDGGRLLSTAGRDVVYAARLLRRSPGVVAVTIVGLGLAIGVGTSVFSLLNAVAFRGTGVDDPSTAVRVFRGYKNGSSTSWTYADYAQLRDASSRVALEAYLRDAVWIADRPHAESIESVSAWFVTGGYLPTLTKSAALGRFLTPADDVIGAPPAIVVSHRFWVRRLDSDPAVVGRTLWLNGVAFTIVGVSQRQFSGTTDVPPAFWVPISSYHVVYGGRPFDRAARAGVSVVGRIQPGVEAKQAETELGAIAVGIAATLTDSTGELLAGVRFVPAGDARSRSENRTMALVVAIVLVVIGLLLLLACVNVANLLLASAWSRQREIGLQLALGASRGRLVRQLLTESLSLGLVGGAVGLVFTVWLVPILAVIARAPLEFDATPDFRVYLFLTAVSIAAGLGAGLAPARHAIRDEFIAPLKGAGGRADQAARPRRFRSGLIGVQAAASLVLLVLAALLTRGMVRATQVDVGFDADRLLTVSPAFGRDSTYDAAGTKAYWDLALERVRALPGVRGVSLAHYPPFGGAHSVTIRQRANNRYSIYHHPTQAEYFATIGLRVVRGRTYTPQEVAERAKVAVISEALAREYFPQGDPIGQSLQRITKDSGYQIIGVVSDAITARLRELSAANIYKPMEDIEVARMIIRAHGRPESLTPSVRNAIQPIDPRIRLDITSVNEGLQEELAEPRTLATLAGACGHLPRARGRGDLRRDGLCSRPAHAGDQPAPRARSDRPRYRTPAARRQPAPCRRRPGVRGRLCGPGQPAVLRCAVWRRFGGSCRVRYGNLRPARRVGCGRPPPHATRDAR